MWVCGFVSSGVWESRRTEDGDQRTEDGGLRTEDGGLRTEDGGLRTEDGGRKTEDRRLRTEDRSGVRDQRTEDIRPSTFLPAADPPEAEDL